MTLESRLNEENTHHRPIRSFVKRAGKLTKGQAKAIESLWPSYGVDLTTTQLDFVTLFGGDAKRVLEIGFGNGLSLARMAQNNPDTHFFGIEVHEPGVGSLLVQVGKHQLHNIRVSREDAVLVLQQQIPASSVDRIQIFFPDPWHKKRHHKRRLLQPTFVNQLLTVLKPQGVLHIATDWENYAEHIVEILHANTQLRSLSETPTELGSYQQRPEYRPQTKYETRGQRLGHGVWDIVFQKI